MVSDIGVFARRLNEGSSGTLDRRHLHQWIPERVGGTGSQSVGLLRGDEQRRILGDDGHLRHLP
ncbi:MAG: hypothetical protein J0M24_20710 [Verrucomicrobia bacterium]|nr:hypothetical protein [Verrucomicrobiota bacterium]